MTKRLEMIRLKDGTFKIRGYFKIHRDKGSGSYWETVEFISVDHMNKIEAEARIIELSSAHGFEREMLPFKDEGV